MWHKPIELNHNKNELSECKDGGQDIGQYLKSFAFFSRAPSSYTLFFSSSSPYYLARDALPPQHASVASVTSFVEPTSSRHRCALASLLTVCQCGSASILTHLLQLVYHAEYEEIDDFDLELLDTIDAGNEDVVSVSSPRTAPYLHH